MIKKYSSNSIIFFALFLIAFLFLYSKSLGVYQNLNLITISLTISAVTVFANSISSILVSKMDYFNDLTISMFNSALKAVLPILVSLSH